MTFAFSKALAMESLELPTTYDVEAGKFISKFDQKTGKFNNVTFEDFENYAKIVAYKVAYNLKNGFKMDPNDDPLTYVDCGGNE